MADTDTQGPGFTAADLSPAGHTAVKPEIITGFSSASLAPKTEDDWLQDESFIADARTLAPKLNIQGLGVDLGSGAEEYMESQQGTNAMFKPPVGIDELQAGMAAANEAYVAPEFTDQEYAEGAMQAIGQIQWNLPDLGFVAMGIEEWSDEEQMALIRTMERYDAMPLELRHFGRAAKGIATDISTYAGFGLFAQAAKGLVLKGGATALLKSLMSKKALGAGVVAGAEGAVYGGADNVGRQVIDNKGDLSKVDTGEVGQASAIGLGTGLTLGFSIAKLFSPPKVRQELRSNESPELSTTESLLPEGDGPVDVDDMVGADTPRIDAPEEVPNAAKDDGSLEGELLDDPNFRDYEAPNTDVSTVVRPRDGETDSLNNGESYGQANDGENFSHLYDGEPTFNVDRLETVDDVKGFINASSDHWEKVRLRDADMNGPDGVETLESARAKADEEGRLTMEQTGGDLSEILEQYKDDHVELQRIRHRAQKMRQINLTVGERVWELAQKHQDTGQGLSYAEAAEFVEMAGLFANTMELTKLASREFSRGLGNYRMIMKGDPDLVAGLMSGKASGDVDSLAKTILSMAKAGSGKVGMADLKAMKKATDKLNDPTFLSELIRFRSAMMLSGPSTIEAAALSNMSKLWTEPFVEWWGHLGRGAEKARGRKRAWAQYAGNRRYFRSSWGQAMKAWKNGQHVTDPFVTKVEDQRDTALANMSFVRRNLWERGVHQAHLALLFLDEGIKANRSRALIYSDTVIEYMDSKLAPSEPGTGVVVRDSNIEPKGDEFEALLAKNMNSKIDVNGKVSDTEILREIRETTYTADLEGKLGNLINDFANLGGGYGRLIVVPFIRAPINIVSESMMYMPFTKGISAKQKNILKEGSPVAKAKLKARKQIGLLAISGMMYAAHEDLMTGSGPSDFKQRELWKAMGYEPNSIRVGDQWVSYSKLGPVGLLMGLSADLVWMMKKDLSNTNLEDHMLEILGGLTYAVTNNILNKAYFSSLQKILDGFNDPDKFTTIIENWFVAFTPNVLSQMNSDENVREASSFMEKVHRRLPVLSEKLGKQYDLYGREITKPSYDIPVYGFMFRNRKVVSDPVAEQVYKLSNGLDRAIIQKVGYELGSTNVDFRDVYDFGETESVYAKYNRMVGEMRDPYTGRTMHQEIAELIKSMDYKMAPHSTLGDITPPKVKMIQTIVNGYRLMAREALENKSPAFRQNRLDRESRIDDIFKM